MSAQSMTDVAFEVLSKYKKPLNFKDLWKKVSGELKMDDNMAMKKISNFYTNLSLDGRFVVQKENMWELKSRVKFKDSFIDTSAIEIDDTEDNDELDFEDKEEEEFSNNNSEDY